MDQKGSGISVEDGFEQRSIRFISWLEKMDVWMSPKISLADFRKDCRGRGIVAVGSFDAEEIIFKIPRTSVLNVKNMLTDFCLSHPEITPGTITAMPNWAALSTIMMSETLQENSKWSPYFDILPKELDSLVFWSPDELAELQASAVTEKLGKAHAEQTYNQIQKAVPLEGGSVDIFHQIASTVMAYAFDIPVENNSVGSEDGEDGFVSDDGYEETVLTMIPLADMLNADADRNNAQLCCDNEDLEMKATKSIANGEEILNDYGDLPQSDLLRRYGYVSQNYAKYDVVEISNSLVLDCKNVFMQAQFRQAEDADFKTRIELAEREGIYEVSYDVSHASQDSSCVPDELVALVYVLLLDPETLSSVQLGLTRLPSRIEMQSDMVGQYLNLLFKIREEQYSTSIEEDEDILRNAQHSLRFEMAVRVRLGEKKILREAMIEVAAYKKHIGRLPAETLKRTIDQSSDLSKKKKLR